MSATAFQRARREAEARKLAEAAPIDYGKLSNDKLKALLDEKGIEYDAKAKKDDLIKLLEGAE